MKKFPNFCTSVLLVCGGENVLKSMGKHNINKAPFQGVSIL
jgi:hypothetical protein